MIQMKTIAYYAVIIFILFVAGIFLWIKTKKSFNTRLANQLKNIDSPNNFLAPFRNISKRITTEDCQAFKKDYLSLFNEADKLLLDPRIKATKLDIQPLKQFHHDYLHLNDLFKTNNKLFDIKTRVESTIDKAHQEYALMFNGDNYLAESTLSAYIDSYLPLHLSLSAHLRQLAPYLAPQHAQYCTEFVDTFTRLNDDKKEYNTRFVANEKLRQKDYFDTALQYPLSDQQRDAIICAEDNCLVISAAGSGKTSTMEGKIKYLVERKGIDPSHLLIITYTRKAANSLTMRLGMPTLRCVTFHKFALDLIGKATGAKPTICDDSVIKDIVYYRLLKQPDFLKSVNKYLFDDLNPTLKEFDFEENPARYIAEAKKRSRISTLPDMDGNYVNCDSDEERKLADIMAKNGILFRHEEPYHLQVADINHRQYKPDFSIYFHDGTMWRKLYLEHFGIDKKGNVPKRFGDGTDKGWIDANQRYHEGIVWKRKLHRDNNTILIETTSANFLEGNVEEVLLGQLRHYGVPIRPLTDQQLYTAMTQSSQKISETVSKLIATFITLMKGKCTTIPEVLMNINPSSQYFQRDRDIIINIITPYLIEYNKVLKERNEIDFTDAILKAAECCKDGCPYRFDYILIDEFQDISIDRYKLLQALRTQKPLTKLFCVGDDWQSIYRFSGSDMALFQQFSDYFGFTEECRLENTFRFFEPMISKSSDFIMKNPLQRKKKVVNPLQGTTDLDIKPYDNDDNVPAIVANIIDQIPSDKSIAILGRYGFEINTLISTFFRLDEAQEYQHIIYKGREIDYLTVHKSKGLEADYVILLSCNSGTYGFPSTISDDHVLNHVLSASDRYEFGEERRLFYVAITRSKQKTWILYKKHNPSIFIEEFEKPVIDESEKCPLCGAPRKMVKQGTSKTGSPYKFYVCTNKDVGCRYSETVFEDNPIGRKPS